MRSNKCRMSIPCIKHNLISLSVETGKTEDLLLLERVRTLLERVRTHVTLKMIHQNFEGS